MQDMSGVTTMMSVLCRPSDVRALVIFRSERSAGTVRGLIRAAPYEGRRARAAADAHAYVLAHPRRVVMLTELRARLPTTFTVYKVLTSELN